MLKDFGFDLRGSYLPSLTLKDILIFAGFFNFSFFFAFSVVDFYIIFVLCTHSKDGYRQYSEIVYTFSDF